MLSSYPKYKYNYIFNNKLNWKSDRCRIVGYFYPLQGVQTFNILRKQSQHFILSTVQIFLQIRAICILRP